MFTGIIEEMGVVKSVEETSSGKQFIISASEVLSDLKIGDSIAVNGVCLTAIEITKSSFKLDLVHETLNKSNLGELNKNSHVNLERAMRLSDRLGGHILQGHVETTGVILNIQPEGDSSVMTIGIDPKWIRYCIPKGSIAIDGVSLTVANMTNNFIEIALIPHTLEVTNLGQKTKGDSINIETDIIGKYVERLLSFEDSEDSDEMLISNLRTWEFGES